MGTGVANFRAACWFRMNEVIFPPAKDKIPIEIRKSINLWEFVTMDARPLMIVDKKIAVIHRFAETIVDSIVFKNQAFHRFAAALDIGNLLRKMLGSKPGSPLYVSGRLWGNYLIHDGRYIIITGDATQYNEALTWTPAEGWRPPEAPTSSYPFQYIQTETSKYRMITRDSTHPTNPMLDWTRKSFSTWVPEHYLDFFTANWKDTPLGDMNGWSGSLRTVVNSIMVHPYQMALYWTKDYVLIYNSSYADVVRNRHPQLLGKELAKGWPEAYEKVHEHLDNCRRGISIIRSGDNTPVDRVDADEECYFDWTLTPILEKAGNVGGVLWQQYEGTARILQNRRREMLKSLRKTTANARNTMDFWPAVLEAFDLNTFDTPFVALYEIQRNNESEAILLGTRGIPTGHLIAPRMIVLAEYVGLFSDQIREARLTGQRVRKEHLLGHECMRDIARRGFKVPCSTAVVIPIQTVGGMIRTEAFIILGINPKKRMDDDYEIWLDQIQENITEYLSGVRIAEEAVQEAMREQLAGITPFLEISFVQSNENLDAERRRASELSARLREVKTELRKKELRFSNMASAIPTGLIEMDHNGSAIFTNDAWHEIMMIARDRREETWSDAIHKDDLEWWCGRLAEAANTHVHLPVEYKVVDTSLGFYNDQNVKWVVSEVLPVYDDDTGDLHGYYSTVADITPLKQAEALQKERADEAQERAKQQERFIDMTCHELRNPLSAILQYSELILDLVDNREMNETLATNFDIDSIVESCNTIILCTTHQRRIIDDILVTSKLDSGLVNIEPVDFHPASYLEKSVKMYEADARSKGINMSFVVEPCYKDLGVKWVKGDPARVMQILTNLITNSIKFTSGQRKKEIEVRLEATLEEPASFRGVEFIKDESSRASISGSQWGDGELVYLIITVIDSGIGIGDDQKNLFGRFQQAPKTEGKYGGSGLGLYICKNMAKLLGGAIGVTSKKGEGAQFSFYVTTRRGTKPDKELALPGWFAQATGKMASSTRTSKNMSVGRASKIKSPVARRDSVVNGFKILVVEDNVINQKVMRRQLEARQCVVYTVNNGSEAVDFIKQSSLNPESSPGASEIEICFMDCEMPVMNGIVASQQIRQMQAEGVLSRHLPILGVSANVRGPKVQEMKDAGMDDVISKPFSIDELVRCAADLVNSQSVEDWSLATAKRYDHGDSAGAAAEEGSWKGSMTEYSSRNIFVGE